MTLLILASDEAFNDGTWVREETDTFDHREIWYTRPMVVLEPGLRIAKAEAMFKKLNSRQQLSKATRKGEPRTDIMMKATYGTVRELLDYQDHGCVYIMSQCWKTVGDGE